MKKTELIKIIKEELQSQMRLKEYEGNHGNDSPHSDRHEASDREMNQKLLVIAQILKDILAAVSNKAAA